MGEAEFKLNPTFDKEVSVNPSGWKKIQVLHSNEIHIGVNYLCWKVKGTDHIFRIPLQIVYEHHGLNYSEHFEKSLSVFREDFLEWREQGFPEEWMKKYKRMFENLII